MTKAYIYKVCSDKRDAYLCGPTLGFSRSQTREAMKQVNHRRAVNKKPYLKPLELCMVEITVLEVIESEAEEA